MTLCNSMDCSWPGSVEPEIGACPWDCIGKNIVLGGNFLIQVIFPTQGSNPHLSCLLHCRLILYHCTTWDRYANGFFFFHLQKQECKQLWITDESYLLCFSLLQPTQVKVLVTQSCRLFGTPWTAGHQVSLSTEFPRQQYWSGLPFPSPGDFPNPGIESGSPTLQADS